MYTHSPADYDCPFCRLAQGLATSMSSQDDVIYRDDEVTAFIAGAWWPNNKGHVVIVPNRHFENIYELPPELALPIQHISKLIALAFKELYTCDGVSTRQHNEPAGNQDVWHYHVHVFPRYVDDALYLTQRQRTTAVERRRYARILRDWLKRHVPVS